MELKKKCDEFVDKCHTDFWYYPKRIFCLMLWVFTIMAVFDGFAINARAVTGDLNLTNHSDFSYGHGETAFGVAVQTWTVFFFNSANWNQVEQIFIDTTGSNTAFATNGASSTFTCSAGCTGGGTFTYSKNSHAMAWYFTNPTIVTSSQFTISYVSNPTIVNDITMPGNSYGMTNGGSSSAAEPVYYRVTTGGFPWTTDNAGNSVTYTVVVDNTIGNTYSITYISGSNQLFETAITKTGQTTVNTRVIIENASGTPVNYSVQGDPLGSYNNNNYDVVNTYGQGITLNISDAIGDFHRYVINTSGSTVPTVTTTPTPPTIPAGQDSAIAFDKSFYSINENGYILYNVSSTITGLLGIDQYRIDFYSTKNPLISQFDIDLSTNTGSFVVSFPVDDAYTANLIEHNIITGTDKIIATDSAQATRGKSYLLVPGTVPVSLLTNVSYQMGYSKTASDNINIRIYKQDGTLEGIFAVPSGSTTINTLYNQSVRFGAKDSYTVQLTSNVFGVLDSKATTAYFTPPNASRDIPAPSFINVTQPTYAFGDSLEYGYQIDTANYTGYNHYIAVYNWNTSATTRVIDTCGKQWMWDAKVPIISGVVYNDNCGAYDMSETDGFTSGFNKLSLHATNTTSDAEIAHVNFTITSTDSAGWGLSIDRGTVCVGDTIRAKVIVPGITPGYLKYGYSGQLRNITVNSSVTVPFHTSSANPVYFELYDGQGTLRIPQTVAVNSCNAPASGSPPGGNQAATEMGNNLTTFMSEPAFWGVIILMAVVIMAAVYKPANAGTIALVFAAIEAVVGMFNPYRWYVLVVVIIILGLQYRESKKASSEG